ncbi:hypothetical protein [Bdellovibrio sp. KM01]|uniref:hypothetical protein n=1 Tax=Bdellovibrio sp. KM01 TaxID=2748865 RepID=UPI0015E95574|nr:hypothetical protein [Bdellovibrio sp. KM01]QLY25692.1 hypothetical protein HW988_01165 [Bdellovibrio sp. KM01]
MTGRDGKKRDSPFIAYLQNQIQMAENELSELGYDPLAWKKLVKHLKFMPGSNDVMFTSHVGFCNDQMITENRRVRGLDAYTYAQIATIAHISLKCRNPQRMFRLGLSLKEKIHFLGIPFILRHAQKKRAAKGGKVRQGKFGELKKLIADIVRHNPKAKRSDILNLFKKSISSKSFQIKTSSEIQIESVSMEDEEIIYNLNDERYTVGYQRISDILSEVRRLAK